MTESGAHLKTLKVRPIKKIRVFDNKKSNESYSVECLDGRAKWIPNSCILSIKVHLITDDLNDENFLHLSKDPKTSILRLQI
jgi:hypothetical protein